METSSAMSSQTAFLEHLSHFLRNQRSTPEPVLESSSQEAPTVIFM